MMFVTAFAAAFAAKLGVMVAGNIISSDYVKGFAVDNSVCDLFPCGIVYALHGSARNVYLSGTFLLRVAFKVDETYDFIFVDCEYDFAFGSS